jgi:hypothetical protein
MSSTMGAKETTEAGGQRRGQAAAPSDRVRYERCSHASGGYTERLDAVLA